MAQLSFLMTAPRTPFEALAEYFKALAVLEPSQVTLAAIDVGDLLGEEDRAWRWSVEAGRPRLYETSGVAQVFGEDGEPRPPEPHELPTLTHGVVVYVADYGGYLVGLETGEGDSDAELVEYCLGVLQS